VKRRVIVFGTGLIGTSVALALSGSGAEVELSDRDPQAVRLAAGRGAGTSLAEGPPDRPADIAVLAVPPAAMAETLLGAQKRGLALAYTDVSSVKGRPIAEAAALGCDLSTFVGGHPLSGGERSGPAAARADLFRGRPWVLCPGPETDQAAIGRVRALVRACGALPCLMDAERHDHAVALVSHAPHVVSSAMAARLLHGEHTALGLAGQGLRDVTRIAGGNPALWLEILSANAGPVADVLDEVAADLADTARALRSLGAGVGESAGPVMDVLVRGSAGRDRVPAPPKT
jgi:prephenate dehydrogenase